MFKLFRTAAIAALLTVTTYAVALEKGDKHPDTYTVQKGDTLWGLAKRLFKNPGCGLKSGKLTRRSTTRI